MGQIGRKFKSFLGILTFIPMNIFLSRRLGPYNPQKYDEFLLRGMSPSDFFVVNDIYRALSGAGSLARVRKILYRLIGHRLVVIAENPSGEVVGINCYYFNQKDWRESTIHEGFIGVMPSGAGRGLASEMRLFSIRHFSESKLHGISSRVSASNIASLRSAYRVGFEVVEEYHDDASNELRYYLVRYFE